MSLKQRYILDVDDVVKDGFMIQANANEIVRGINKNANEVLAVRVGGLGATVFNDGEFIYYNAAAKAFQSSGNVAGTHNHDDRYYTEAEMDASFEGKDAGKYQVDWARVVNKPELGTQFYLYQGALPQVLNTNSPVPSWAPYQLHVLLANAGILTPANRLAVILKCYLETSLVGGDGQTATAHMWLASSNAVGPGESLREFKLTVRDDSSEFAADVAEFIIPLSDDKTIYAQWNFTGSTGRAKIHVAGFISGINRL
jgi:hypothetical protein